MSSDHDDGRGRLDRLRQRASTLARRARRDLERAGVDDVLDELVIRIGRRREDVPGPLAWLTSTWPMLLVGIVGLGLWVSLGLDYFGASRWSWTSMLGVYGLATTLYLSHRFCAAYWPLYNRIRRTGE